MVTNDYSLIGGFGEARFLPIERIPTGLINHVNDVSYLKNLDETDISFIESLYRNSNPDYYMGGWMVKAVTDVLLEFMCGKLPKINANDDEYSKFCNRVWNANSSKLYGAFRELGLFGQEWIYVGYDQRTGLPKYRPICKKNVVDIRYEDFDDPDEITYIRIRDTFETYTDTNETLTGDTITGTIIFDKIFWKELNPKYSEYISDLTAYPDGKSNRKRSNKNNAETKSPDKWLYYMKILKRDESSNWTEYQKKTVNPLGVIPVVELNQNRLSIDKSGYSDVSGALKIIGVYHQLLESAVNNNLYNQQPTLKFTGIEGKPIDFVQQMYGSDLSSGDTLDDEGVYGVYGSYYLPGHTDVNWLSTPDHTSSSSNLLEKVFYILVQVTGVPEWALGASITGAWATVRQQAVPLMQKIHAKRMDINDELLRLCWLSTKVMALHNPTETYEFDFDAEIVWDDVLTRETNESLVIMESLLSHGLITEETALAMIDVVSDPVKELELVREARRKQNEQLQDANAFANEQIQSKVLQLFKSKQKEIADDENAEPEVKQAAGEMLNLSDSSILKILGKMLDDNMFE